MKQIRRLLSIDGGGVKVSSALAVLEELETTLASTGKTLLDVFDVFAGTSAGALVVAALVYGGLTAKEIRQHFFTKEALERMMPQHFYLEWLQMTCKYDGVEKRKMINEIIKPDCRLRDTLKVVVITAYDTLQKQPIVFCSECEETSSILLRDLLDGASAAPTYYPLVYCTSLGRPLRLIDGAVFCNNPAFLAYTKMNEIYEHTLQGVKVLSLGTGEHSLEKPTEVVNLFQYETPLNLLTYNSHPHRDNAGGLEWLTEGDLMGIIYESPQMVVDMQLKSWTNVMRDSYVRVNGRLPSNKIDDITPSNLKALIENGKQWWEANKTIIWAFIVLTNDVQRSELYDDSSDESDDSDEDDEEVEENTDDDEDASEAEQMSSGTTEEEDDDDDEEYTET